MSRTFRRQKAKSYKRSWVKLQNVTPNDVPSQKDVIAVEKAFFHSDMFRSGTLLDEKRFWKKISSKRERSKFKHMLQLSLDKVFDEKRIQFFHIWKNT